MRYILSSLLARRSHSAALIIEIVIVTIIGFIVMEPTAVNTTKALLPAGYDYDHLAMLKISYQDQQSEDFDSAYFSTEEYGRSQSHLLNMLRDLPEVERATFTTSQSFDQSGSSTTYLPADSIYRQGEGENYLQAYIVNYIADSDFFGTFGITDMTGESIKEPEVNENAYIVSESLAKGRYAGGEIIGRDLYEYDEEDEEDHHTPIVGITSDVIYRKGLDRTPIAFRQVTKNGFCDRITGITVRLAENVNPRAFIYKISNQLSQYRSGNLYLTQPVLYSDMREAAFQDKERELTRNWTIAVFFLVNVFLGVAGTFYVQCRSRIPDAGVMRAFGATKRRIELNLMGEVWSIVFIGWIFGLTIYLIYLKVQGFIFSSDTAPAMRILSPLWYDTPIGRYAMIGGIVLLLLLLVATLGAWLPASKVGHVPIVDSLRDE